MFFGVDTSEFMPHGHCILWKPQLLFPIVISDIFIFLAYTSIPIALFIFYKKRTDLTKNTRLVLILFFLFIQLCGITHLISAYNYWHSQYVIEMFFKVATAVVSVATAISLFKLLPQLIKLPSPSEHLKLIEELKTLNQNLEQKVKMRTEEVEEQKALLLTLLQGQPGIILKYEPRRNDNDEIIDFKSQILHHDESFLSDHSDNFKFESDSILDGIVDSSTNGHFESAKKAFTCNLTITEDPLFFQESGKYFRNIFYKKNASSSLFVYFADVTRREHVKMDAMINSKLISLGELAGGIAHEINSPLQVISLNTRRLARSIEKPSEIINKSVDSINETVGKISDIILNLKRLSRGDAGEIKEVSLNQLLDTVLAFYEQKFKVENISLKKNYHEDFIVNTNEISFFQIINNLVSNAVDALSEINHEKIIRIEVYQDESNIIISICNNGPLISEDNIERIFDPLFTKKQVGKGTGLGLSLSKKLAQDIAGDLYLTQDKFVCFNLKLEKL